MGYSNSYKPKPPDPIQECDCNTCKNLKHMRSLVSKYNMAKEDADFFNVMFVAYMEAVNIAQDATALLINPDQINPSPN